MNRYELIVSILLLISSSQNVDCLNVLAIVSLPLRSHYMAFHSLFRELANHGHSVTVMNNYPDETSTPNLTFVDLSGHVPFRNNTLALENYETVDANFMHLVNIKGHIDLSPYSASVDCENLFTNENMKAHLAKGTKYDVIFVEQFMCDCGLLYAAATYDAPIIGITSHVLLPWAYPRLGLSFDFSSDAFYFSNGGPNPSLYHKVEAVLMNWYMSVYGQWVIESSMQKVFMKYRPEFTVDLDRISRERLKMMFAYQHHSVTGARVLAPQLLEIGGIHIGKTKAVPEVIEKFLSTAEHGAIYVSFGSNLKSSTMSQKKLAQFLAAFKRIPQKVLWKWENGTLAAGNDNIYTSSWMPQLDILCHPKVVGFVSHGGMLSLSEAAHCGKPLITIPFFGDQFSNAAAVRAAGFGVTLFFSQLDADALTAGINELTSKRMQENAKTISRLWHDRPSSVMDSAIYWTEYVARHRTAPPGLPSQNSSWFESLSLDVYIVFLCLVISILTVIYFVVKLIKLILLDNLLVRLFNKKIKEE